MRYLIYLIVSWASVCSALCQPAEAADGIEEAKRRLEKMLVDLESMPACYSVECAAQLMVEPAKNPDSESEDRSFVMESLFRFAGDKSRGEVRFDCYTLRLRGTDSERWDHLLKRPGTGMHAFAINKRIGLQVREFEKEKTIHAAFWGGANMLMLPITDLVGVNSPLRLDYLQIHSDLKPIAGKWEGDQFVGVYESKDAQFARVIKFEKHPEWAPVQNQAFYIDKHRTGEGNIVFDLMKKWSLLSETYSDWKQHAEDRWVPSSVRMHIRPYAANQETMSAELVFVNWEFEEGVERDRFEENRFTKENLLKIDFQAIKDAIKKNFTEAKAD